MNNHKGNLSRFLTEDFLEKINKTLRLKRVKIAWREFQREKQRLEQLRKFYSCVGNTPHNFQKWKREFGYTRVCTKCAQEDDGLHLTPSVYAHKGRRFEFKAKDKFQAAREYAC